MGAHRTSPVDPPPPPRQPCAMRALPLALLAASLLAACAVPVGPDDARLDPGPPITGRAGIGYTNAEVRADLVAPLCAARGLAPATIAIGPIDGTARAVRATCA